MGQIPKDVGLQMLENKILSQGIIGISAPILAEITIRKSPHSTRFSGGGYQCSSKAARSEDLQVEHPIRCGYSPTFDFHPTLPRMHGSPLIRYQVVQVCQPRQKRLLAAAWMVKRFHHKQFAVNGIMRLIKQSAGDRHLRVFEDSIPPPLS